MQLDEAFGIEGVRGENMFGEVGAVLPAVLDGRAALPALVVTVATAGAVLAGRRWLPRAPIALVAVVVATAVALLGGLDAAGGLPIVADRAAVPSGWPPGAMPLWDPELMKTLVGPAAAIALLDIHLGRDHDVRPADPDGGGGARAAPPA